MPQNLPEQILQRIVRLSTDGNSLREVATMLGVSQGCISKILRRNRETGRPHQMKRGGSMKISTPREDRQLLRMIRTNRFISAPRLWMQMIRRFGRRMSVRTIRRRLLAAGYWSRRPARCPRLTLEHRWRRRECIQPNDGNRGPSVMVWVAIHQGGGGVSWSLWMEPWTGIGTSRSWGIKCCHGDGGVCT